MPQLTQGLIVATLIGLLLAVIVGYYLRQGRVNELTEALQQSQKRQEELEKEHEQRLRTATQQLQKDYEAQLAEKMEQYQDQFEARRGQLESEYHARQSVMGGAPIDADNTIEQRIRKQYETRLKEAATKIQQAYEQHLQDKLVEARSQSQQDYDQRLADAIAHYQDQDQARQTQAPSAISLGALVPEPTAVASTNTSDTAEIEARFQAEYEQRLADYQDDTEQRLAQMQQDYETRLQVAQGSSQTPAALDPSVPDPSVPDPSAAELELNLRRELGESLRAEYEQKLAEKIEHYQDELTQRTLELEQAYEARLQLQVAPFPEPPVSPADGPAVDLDMAMLEEAMPPEVAIANEADLLADSEISLDMNEFSSMMTSPGLDEGDSDLAALLEGEADGDQVDDFGLDADFNADSLDLNALLNEPVSAPNSELAVDEFAPEAASSELEESDFGLAALLEGEAGSGQVNDFGLEDDFNTDNLDLDVLLNRPPSGPTSDELLDDLDDLSNLS